MPSKTDQSDRPAHRMRDQQPRQRSDQLSRRKRGQIAGIAIEVSCARPGCKNPRSARVPLPTPVQTPDLNVLCCQIAYRLEVFFDEFPEAADQHALRASAGHREVTPAESSAVERVEMAPLEISGLQKTPFECR